MLGAVCFRLSVLGRATTTATSPLPQSSQSVHRLHSGNLVSLQSPSPAIPQAIHGSSVFARGKLNILSSVKENNSLKEKYPLIRFKDRSSSCLLAANGIVVATIWHALLPSRHLSSSVVRERLPPRKTNTRIPKPSEGNRLKQAEWTHVIGPVRVGICQGLAVEDGFDLLGTLGSLAGRFVGLNGKLPVATGWQDGSWNVASDARPARWLHGRNSAWLLFGVCSRVTSAEGAEFPAIHSRKFTLADAIPIADNPTLLEDAKEDQAVASHGKPVIREYNVTGIPGDGRCLFRAVAYGACLRKGKPALTEITQRRLADELRNKVVDELILHRSQTEWFIEGDFDIYTQQMREPHIWGGEPELLMLSHVLKMPITVYMSERNSKGIIAIAEYGKDYGEEQPICLLYHGFGHYDALQLPEDTYSAEHLTAADIE